MQKLIALVFLSAMLAGPVAAQTAPAAQPAAPAQPVPAARPAAPPAAAAKPAAAAPAPAATGPEIEVDPIDCSWRTDKTAVEVGERFTLTLTCGIVETPKNKVVVDPSQLDASALSLAPFDIVSGARHEDVIAPPRRYFQYEYSVRVIGNAFFGLDVDLPSLSIKYSIMSSLGDTGGREHQYALPALPIRVLSLVPAKASDIRDTSRETFGDREARRRRAGQELVAAAIAFGFAVVLVGLAIAKLVGQYRKRTRVATRPLSPSALLGACLASVRRLKSEVAADGWNEARVVRALALLRVGAAVALGRPVAQTTSDHAREAREGQVTLRTMPVGGRHALISASTSPAVVERQLAAVAIGGGPAAVVAALGELREALGVFGKVRYGRGSELDAVALDNALDSGAGAIRRLRVRNLWPMRMAGTVIRTAAVVGAAVWLR